MTDNEAAIVLLKKIDDDFIDSYEFKSEISRLSKNIY
jgi:hypothetical protein